MTEPRFRDDDPPDDPPAAFQEARARGGFPGAQWLVGESPGAVLARLEPNDPLHIGERADFIRRRDAWFVSPERARLRSLARVAFASMDYAGTPPLGEWLESCVEQALLDLRNDQFGEEYQRIPPVDEQDVDYYRQLAELSGFEEGMVRLMCLVLNYLPAETRRAFHAIHIEKKTIHRYVAEGHGPPDKVKRLIREAMVAILLVAGGEEDPGGHLGV